MRILVSGRLVITGATSAAGKLHSTNRDEAINLFSWLVHLELE
jgi:hypothetical protein